ncbi:MAG TPA: hypothetical protein PLL33_05585 [Paracoccus sp. (in: a-proteobacteria)]|nr:hypothetical protein [Paracoccus sp. (in: a-proteobacteria)]
MSECRRNCWIAAGIMGLVVWALTAGAGPLGAFSGLFLGILTAVLLGPTLAWLFCDAAVEDDAMTFDGWSAASAAGEAPARGLVMDAVSGGPVGAAAFAASGGSLARPPRPAQSSGSDAIRLGAPEGATANAAQAVTFTSADETQAAGGADTAEGGKRPSSHQAPDILSTEAPAANDTPIADTRAVMYTPSESERHDMPGEAVPSAEPGPRQSERARMVETGDAGPAGTKG